MKMKVCTVVGRGEKSLLGSDPGSESRLGRGKEKKVVCEDSRWDEGKTENKGCK